MMTTRTSDPRELTSILRVISWATTKGVDLEPVAAPCENAKIQISGLVSYRIDRLVSSRIGSSRLGRIVSSPRDASVRLPRERRETPDTRTKSCRPGQAARGWRQLVIAAEHRRRGLRCWLSPRRRFHVSPAQSGAETSRKCASSQLLMDLRREPSPPSSSTAGPARPWGLHSSVLCEC